jgi:hypothetical protein
VVVAAEVAEGPVEVAKGVLERVAADLEGEEPGQRAAGAAAAGPAREGCRVRPGAGSARALPVIPKSPISPASPASIGTVRTAGPA